MILLYKGKCIRGVCGHYHGIVLLSPALKVLMGILLSRLNPHIVDTVLTESESSFRPNKPMIPFLTARQIQEKSNEQQQCLFSVFVYLTKAFDTVNREPI